MQAKAMTSGEKAAVARGEKRSAVLQVRAFYDAEDSKTNRPSRYCVIQFVAAKPIIR